MLSKSLFDQILEDKKNNQVIPEDARGSTESTEGNFNTNIEPMIHCDILNDSESIFNAEEQFQFSNEQQYEQSVSEEKIQTMILTRNVHHQQTQLMNNHTYHFICQQKSIVEPIHTYLSLQQDNFNTFQPSTVHKIPEEKITFETLPQSLKQKFSIQEKQIINLYNQSLKKRKGRPKETGVLSQKLGHFWRDIQCKFKNKLILLLQENKQYDLKNQVESMFIQTQRKRYNNHKWYVNLFKVKKLHRHLRTILSEQNFDQIINNMECEHRLLYRSNRIPVLAMFLMNLTPLKYKKFRNYYLLYHCRQSST